MGWIAWIIFGLVAGAIAKALMPRRDPGGLVVTILLGIVGAVVGGWIGAALWGSNGVHSFDIRSLVMAVFGAIVVLGIYRALSGRRGGGSSSSGDVFKRAA